MPKIDPLDRQFILLLNGMAYDARRLCEITNNLDAFKAFLVLLHARQIELDRAVESAIEAAERRAA